MPKVRRLDASAHIEDAPVRAVFDIEDARGNFNGVRTLWKPPHLEQRSPETLTLCRNRPPSACARSPPRPPPAPSGRSLAAPPAARPCGAPTWRQAPPARRRKSPCGRMVRCEERMAQSILSRKRMVRSVPDPADHRPRPPEPPALPSPLAGEGGLRRQPKVGRGGRLRLAAGLVLRRPPHQSAPRTASPARGEAGAHRGRGGCGNPPAGPGSAFPALPGR